MPNTCIEKPNQRINKMKNIKRKANMNALLNYKNAAIFPKNNGHKRF